MKIRTAAIAAMCLVSTFGVVVVAGGAEAVDDTWWVTVCPVSVNATLDLYYYSYHTDYAVDGTRIANDSDTQDLYSSVAFTCVFENNDFTNVSEWSDNMNDIVATDLTRVGYLPHADATIYDISVFAWFTNRRPNMEVQYTTDNWTSSNTTGMQSDSYLMHFVWWNITSLEDWTPSMVNNTDFKVKAICYPTALTHYYFDYLGLIITWYGEYEGGGTGPEGWEADTDGDYINIIFTEGGLLGVLGAIGLAGMIATPAMGIYLARHSQEGKMNVFVKMTALFMICLSFFMVSVSGV